MDNPEEVMQILERFNVQKNPEINPILEEYLQFVARTGDSVYAWALVKNLFREKLINVITDFHQEASGKELPQYPNVDPFNYETMKKMLLEKLDSFQSAPFTIQRISELLSEPKKQYSRIDKFMRAVEKTILVVSTIPPGRTRTESSDSLDSGMNGDYSDVNVDVDMDGGALEHKKINNSHDEPTAKVDEDATAVSKDDNVNGTITQVTVDSVSITVIEPERSKAAEESTASPTKTDNEPLRSADNEILVETAELISETPPLAALENIVATTTVKIDATVLTPEIAVTTAAAVVVTEKIEPVAVAEQLIVESETETEKTTESDESEAKRMKLSEEETTKETEVAATVVVAEVTAPTEPAAAAAEVEVAEPAAATLVAEPTESVVEVAQSETAAETLQEETFPLPAETASVVTEPTVIAEVVETPPEAPPVAVAATVCETVDPPPTTTVPTPAAVEDEPVPIQEVDVPVAAPVIEPIVAEMDAAPILQPEIAVEKKMDDEEQSTAVAAASTPIEQEMTPVESGKMETDESTTVEAAPMEFEDGAEPMDQ